MKRELSQRAKQSIYQSIFVSTPIYGQKEWVTTKRKRLWIKAAEMDFLRRVAGVSVISEGLEVELLLLCIERSQLRWFGHLVWMPPSHLPREVFQAHPAGRRPQGRPRSRWNDCISALAWYYAQCRWPDTQHEKEPSFPCPKQPQTQKSSMQENKFIYNNENYVRYQ